MHKKEKSCLGVRELLENKGKCVTHFSGTVSQYSPRHRSRHWSGHSDHRSYRGERKQLGKGKEEFCAPKSRGGSTSPKHRLLVGVPALGEQLTEVFFLTGVGKVPPQRVVWAGTWMEAPILCCLWKECARNRSVDS